MAFNDLLIHNCTIYRKVADPSGNVNAYGQPVYTETSATSICKFFRGDKFRQAGILIASDLDHFVIPISVMLPATASILKDDKITTTTAGYAGTYTVSDIKTAYGKTSIHHYTANIVRVA